jgi:ribokinase
LFSELDEHARKMRQHIIRMTSVAGSGHLGPSFSPVEIMATLSLWRALRNIMPVPLPTRKPNELFHNWGMMKSPKRDEPMKKPRIVVVGSCNMDIYSWTAHLPEPGETVIGDRYWMGMGGKGANQAVAACRLGADVTMVGRVGNDLFGKQMLETLASYGVGCDFINIDQEAGSGIALVTVDKKPENVIVVVPGTNMRITTADVVAAEAKIREADVLLMQLEIPLDVVECAADIASQSNTLCILNPAPARPVPERLVRKVDLLTPNQHEARQLSELPADTLEGARAAGKALLKMGAAAAIVTLGADGALLVKDNDAIHVEGIRVEDAVDPTGAGDAFMGGLGVALARGESLEDATRYANYVGALSTRKPGAMPSMPATSDVDAFIRSLG